MPRKMCKIKKSELNLGNKAQLSKSHVTPSHAEGAVLLYLQYASISPKMCGLMSQTSYYI
jgi:NADPH-dependent curcumin reductase CurA